MKEIESIVGIYHYFDTNIPGGDGPKYFLIYLLDEKGFLELKEAKKIFEERFNSNGFFFESNQKIIGPFESLESLNQFSFALCEHLNAAKISLISVEEYNLLLEETQDATSFLHSLNSKGNVIENIERKKKGFFSKLFS